jgi:hypothetical protein
MKRYILLLLLCVQGLYAQVEFKAVPSKTKLGINEKLTIDFIMNGDGDNFSPPSFSRFSVSGPLQNIQNPAKGREYSKTYTYILSPKARGTFIIGQASIEIRGKTYKTIPFKVTVGAAVQTGSVSTDPDRVISEGMHYVAEVSNPNPYINEPVTVVYKLYVNDDVSIRDWKEMDRPEYNDFWSQNIDIPNRVVEKGQFKGQIYRYVTLRKTVLYPQKNGRLPLDPLSLDVMVEKPTGRLDALGNEVYRVVHKVISTGSNAINVKALPENGKPAGYAGAVGRFELKVTPSKTTLGTGESLELEVSVTGSGNMKLFKLPRPVVPAALEMYDPEHRENVSTPLSGMQGKVSDVYTIIPQFKGKFIIKPISFSFFDPKLGVYRTVSSAPVTINVPDGPDATAAAYEDAQGTKKQDVAASGQFRFIALETSLHKAGKKDFMGSPLFYILLLLPFLLVPVVIMLRKKKQAIDSDVKGNRTKQTNKLAKQYLDDAKSHMGDKEPFYIALEKALHNFLKAKLSIETSDMTKQNIRELLLARTIDATTVERLIQLIDNCEFARYAPSTGAAMQQDYEEAVLVVTALEKQI